MTNKIIKGSTTISDDKIIGGVNYEHNINYNKNITLGNTPSACITFTTLSGVALNVDDSVTYQKMSSSDTGYVTIGTFIITEKKELNNSRTQYTAYDNMELFEKYVDSWYSGITYPITLQNFFNSLVNFCAGTGHTSTLPINGSHSIVKQMFVGQNFKGKEILSLIASLAGGYACAGADGKIYIRNFSTGSATTLTSSQYIKRNVENQISAPSVVIYSKTSDSVGVKYPASGSGKAFHIINNPLMGELQSGATALQNIYNKVHFSYYPMTVSLYEDYGINAGDAITVDGKTGIVFDKLMNSSGVVFSCTGEETDDVMPDINTELRDKFGKTFSLKQDISGISADITDIGTRATEAYNKALHAEATASGFEAIITEHTEALGTLDTKIDTVETNLSGDISDEITRATGAEGTLSTAISVEVSRATTAEATITATANQIRTDLTSETNARVTAIDTLSGEVSAEVTRATTAESSIDQKADRIKLSVEQEVQDRVTAVGNEYTRATAAESAIDQKADNINIAVRQQITTEVNGEKARAEAAESAIDVKANNINLRVTQEVTDRTNAVNGEKTRAEAAEAAIDIKADNIGIKVAKVVDGSNNIKAASIVAAVNDAGSSVKIDADHIELGGQVVIKDNAEVQTTLSILNPDPDAPSGPVILSNDEYGLYISDDYGPADVTLGTVDASNIYVNSFTSKCMGITYTSVRQFLIDLDDYVYSRQPGTFYTISASVNPSGTGYIDGGGKYLSGDTCTLTAYALAGYSFDGWYSGSTRVSTSSTYSFTVTSNRTLTARFSGSATRTIQLRVSSDWDGGYWSRTPMGSTITQVTVPYDGSVTLYFCRDCCDCDPVGDNFEWELSSTTFCDRPTVVARAEDYAILEVTGIVGNGTITAIQGG